MNPKKDYHEIYDLLIMLVEGDLTDSQAEQLVNWSKTDPDAVKIYADFMNYYSIIGSELASGANDNTCSFDTQFDRALADATVKRPETTSDSNTSLRGVDLDEFNLDAGTEDSEGCGLPQEILELLELERTSPAVEKEKPEPVEPERELIQKVESNFKWFPGRPSKHKTRALLAMVACIMAVFGYIYFFAPENIDRPVVAKLDDSIRAEWDNELATPDEFGDMVQSRYILKKGFITILFNDGAKVIVEAPAELSLDSPSAMELFSGRIYSIVPSRAKGFAVTAASSKIVDLGTEFGVEVDSSGNTQLHVTKGRTVLFAGLPDGEKEEVKVDAGAAKKVYDDGFVKDIEIAKDKFVRQIDSQGNSIYKGQYSYRTLSANGKTFNAYFEEHDGKTWLLIGRGREGWEFDADGQGSINQVSQNLKTPAAFTPAYYSDAIVNDLLSQADLSMADVEIRISRASTIDGKGQYQDIRWRDFNPAENGNAFTWNFEDSKYSGITIERVNAPAGLPGASVGSIVGDTYDTSEIINSVITKSGDHADRLFTHLPQPGVNNQMKGFSYGKAVVGVNAQTSFLLSYEYSGSLPHEKNLRNWAIPYTEVYINYPNK